MRTEVKAGLIAGLVIIAGVVFWVVKQGGSGKGPSTIPFDVKTPGKNPDIIDVQESGREARRPGTEKPATAPPAKPPLSGNPAARPTEHPTTRPSTPLTGGPPGGAPDRTVPGTTRPLPPIVGASEPGARPTSPIGSPATGPGEHGTSPTGPAATPTRPGEESREPAATRPTPVIPGPITNRPMLEPPTTRPAVTPTTPLRPTETVPTEHTTPPKETPKPATDPNRYTVQSGDTLSSIAREHYGDSNLWTRIRDANPTIDPDRILEGQVLVLPPKEGKVAPAAATEKPAKNDKKTEKKTEPAATPGKTPETKSSEAKSKPAQTTHVVQAGETLVGIARALLGDPSRWHEIYELNKDKIKNPDRLLEGTTLKIPAKEKNGQAKPKKKD